VGGTKHRALVTFAEVPEDAEQDLLQFRAA
jgi:hypothetical protein